MIEQMKMVHIITSASRKEEMLSGLRDIGVMHLAEKQSADREVTDRFQTLTKTATALRDYADPKKKGRTVIVSGEEFDKIYETVLAALEKKAAMLQEISQSKAELDRISAWGDFSPAELEYIRDAGFDFRFYRMGEKEYRAAAQAENVKLIRLSSVDKQRAVAALGALPPDIQATELVLPERGVSELRRDIERAENEIKECEATLRAASVYDASFKAEILKLQNSICFSEAEATADGDDDFVWLSGYIPESDLNTFKRMAAEKGCAWAASDVSDEDDNVPTKVKYNRVSKLIRPVFDVLGILPGYREQDISLWFFMFFILFFAMIIGDGAYGVIILAGAVALHIKQKKLTDVTFLLYVLSIATIVWGAITGTWFGTERAMDVPFLKMLVVPSFATYPERFGLTSTASQNTIMKLSFSIGAVQMALGAILSIKKKLAAKDLSWLADLGWMIAIAAMYLLSLNLVLNENINLPPVFIAIGAAFLLVVLFGAMSPGVSFGKGLASGAKDAFTVFLNTISCFGNVMSYIRLFAVGMAGVAISQSFNGIAAGMSGPLVIAGAVVVIIGHVINIIMCFLSVVVHGVRLNVLEFSGQAGIEWTGIPYEPFKALDK